MAKPRSRPRVVKGETFRVKYYGGYLYVTVNLVRKHPFEVFCHVGHATPIEKAHAEELGRLVSLCLRIRTPVGEIVKQLIHIDSGEHTFIREKVEGVNEGDDRASLPEGVHTVTGVGDAVAKILKRYVPETPEEIARREAEAKRLEGYDD